MKKIALLIEEFNASICEIEKSNLDQLTALDKKNKKTNDCLQQFRKAIRNDGFHHKKMKYSFSNIKNPIFKGGCSITRI